MTQNPDRVLITGANGHLGRKLVLQLAESGVLAARAFVRSKRAAETLQNASPGTPLDLVVGDYADVEALTEAMRGCRYVVHFVGIIKESKAATYQSAHEATCESLSRAAAAAGIERIVYLSILGSSSEHANRCLASKGRAEDILLSGRVPTSVLRVPMVIGEGDFAATALRRQATSRRVALIAGGRTRQQPIDAHDVLRGVIAALTRSGPKNFALDLAGPENLSQRELVTRAARVLGFPTPSVVPIPLCLVRGLVAAASSLMPAPPMTRDMLEILEHDDRVDVSLASEMLGLSLIPLDDTLARCLVEPAAHG